MLPKHVTFIIETLEEHGYEAYAVGGCVRDSILGRIPGDWDITTSAKPEETKALFRRTVDTGLQHGTITVLLEDESYEVTTYRIDGAYEDNRHPKEVTYTANLLEDLKRRDFTINAMAYNEKVGIIDAFGGAQDLKNGVIRCVGDAKTRFSEDALRILRAVRFSAQLGFRIEEKTRKAIRDLAGNLKDISAERIQAEMVKLLISAHPEYIKTAWELTITKVILPEFDEMMQTDQNNPHHRFDVGNHTLEALKAVESDKVLRLAVLFHDIGKPKTRTTDDAGIDHFYVHHEVSQKMAEAIMRRWKFDNDTLYKVSKLVKYHDLHPATTDKSVRRMIHRVGEDLFPYLLKVQRADILAQSEYERAEKLASLKIVEQLYQEILKRGECLNLKDLAITGSDLIQDGMKPGKEIGNILTELLNQVLEDPQKNTREYLIKYSRELRS